MSVLLTEMSLVRFLHLEGVGMKLKKETFQEFAGFLFETTVQKRNDDSKLSISTVTTYLSLAIQFGMATRLRMTANEIKQETK